MLTANLPTVTICTPTFNRRPFIPRLIACLQHQTYPHSLLQWVLVDDGTDSIEDVVKQASLDITTTYLRVHHKMALGEKRNFMHTHATGEMLVYMDDDDYYPPERVAHAVDTLLRHPEVLVAGSGVMDLYFRNLQKTYRFGPYGANHATAATFAFRRELLEQTRYATDKCVAEETFFLKNYTIPMVQLNPEKTILVFSHIHNSVDKMEVLHQGSLSENPYIHESPLTPRDYIHDESLYAFYVENLNSELTVYQAGLPSNKPDVLLNIANNKVTMYEKKLPALLQELQHAQAEIAKLREMNQLLTNRLKQVIQQNIDKHQHAWKPGGA